ncbi:hypothetical protein V8D89_011579 [Ganoderma adspersum]
MVMFSRQPRAALAEDDDVQRGYTAPPRSGPCVGRFNVLTSRHSRKHRAVTYHRRDEALAILVITLLSTMPSAQGRVLPLEFPRRWRRQVSGSSSSQDTASITPSSTPGFGEEWTITETTTETETYSEFSTTSSVVPTSSRTTVRITLLGTGDPTSTSTNSLASPSAPPSPSNTVTRVTEFSGLSIPSLATNGQSSPTAGQGRSSSEPLSSSLTSSGTSTSRRITITPTPAFPSPVSRTTSPATTAFHSYSSRRPHLPLYTDPSLSPPSTLSASDSSPTYTTTLVSSLPVITTIWISLPTTVSITVTAPSQTSIPTLIPITPIKTMSPSLLPSISSSLPTAVSGGSSSTSSGAPSSSASPSMSYSSVTDSLSSTSTASTPVLQQTTTSPAIAPITRTTLYTTIVKTYTAVNGGRTISRTFTQIIPTDTLIPDAGGSNSWYLKISNRFARNKGALAGLILGCIALAGLVAALGLLVYRHHRARSAHNVDAVTALPRGAGRSRNLMLDEDDDDDGGHMGGMAFLGAHPVSRASGGARYALLQGGNSLEGVAEEGAVRRPGVSGIGAFGLPPIPILRGLGDEMADAALMHPENRSEDDVAAAGASNGSSPGLQAPLSVGNSTSGTGPESSAWLMGPAASSPGASTGYFDSDAPHGLPARPMSPSSVYSDDVMSAHPDTPSVMGAMGTYIGGEQLPYGGHNSFASSSTYGYGVAGSSSGGHGSYDDRNAGSSSGDVPSTATHSSHLLLPRPVAASALSSLLPTKTATPTSCHDLGDSEPADRRSGFLGRSLLSLRFRSSPAGLPSAVAVGASSLAGPDSATRQQALRRPLSAQHASTTHFQPPTLSPVPRPLFRSETAVPEGTAPSRIHAGTASGPPPVWSGLGPIPCRSSAPSPALTEGSTRTPVGLLDPKWVNSDGMRSQGALSFRDDMDYSRPIGGLVNNRQHSFTSLVTVSSATTPDRRRSPESDLTDRNHTQAVPIPPEEDDVAPPRYEELSWPAPSIEITPPSPLPR